MAYDCLVCRMRKDEESRKMAGLESARMMQAAQIDSHDASLEGFLNEVRSSCGEHASRKGYISTTGRNVAGDVTGDLGIARPHALGEIYYKWLEFQRTPRRVVAVKIAGWAWRLWTTVDE